ncbi:MAG: alpha/beta hydrolase-fold protein [Betaproteobacteria bacterium]
MSAGEQGALAQSLNPTWLGWRWWTGLVALVMLLATATVSAAATVPVEIDLRAEIAAGRFDPAHDRVGVRGGYPPLSWQRSMMARPLGDGRFGLDIVFGSAPFGGQPVPYKFRIERAGQGPDSGWEPGPNHALRLDPGVRIARAFGAAPTPVAWTRAGTIERLGRIPSAHVAQRHVQVWLPPGYAADALRRYPVLYLHDGQNVFDGESAGAEWMVDETAQRLVEQGAIEAPIIVAVDSVNTRMHDYTPTAMTLPAERTGTGRAQAVGGGAAAYGRFLAEELKPRIDGRYRTRREPASTAVGGSSLGGLVSLWLALHRSDTFGAALVVSPSVWWDEQFALRDVRSAPTLPQPRPRLWLDMGAHEGPEALPAARALQQSLMARGWDPTTLVFTEDEGGHHNEVSWAARVEGMLRFLYPKQP